MNINAVNTRTTISRRLAHGADAAFESSIRAFVQKILLAVHTSACSKCVFISKVTG